MERLGLWSSMSESFPPPRYSQQHETVHVGSCEALERSMRLHGNTQRSRTSCWLLNCQHPHKDIVNVMILFMLSYHHYFLFYLCYQMYTYTDIFHESLNQYASVSTGAKIQAICEGFVYLIQNLKSQNSSSWLLVPAFIQLQVCDHLMLVSSDSDLSDRSCLW